MTIRGRCGAKQRIPARSGGFETRRRKNAGSRYAEGDAEGGDAD